MMYDGRGDRLFEVIFYLAIFGLMCAVGGICFLIYEFIIHIKWI